MDIFIPNTICVSKKGKVEGYETYYYGYCALLQLLCVLLIMPGELYSAGVVYEFK